MLKKVKRVLSAMIIFALCLGNFTVFGAEDNHLTETDATNIAIWFIANDIYENGNNGWSEDTRIGSVEKISDYLGESYVIDLVCKGTDNGYIVVSADMSDNLIREFAYKGEPLLVGLQMLSASNARMASAEDTLDFSAENEKYFKVVRDFDATQLFNDKLRYGNIDFPYVDVNQTYGSGWSYDTGDTVDGEFELLNMNDFEGPMHCSLTSVTAIFNYHRMNGNYPNIPSDVQSLFKDVKSLASEKGYYKDSGTDPWYIDNLVTDLWAKYGYSGKGNNDFFFWSYSTLADTLKGEVSGNRPGTISFYSGSYKNHTVTYYGYVDYAKEGNTNKLYLVVNDNYQTEKRYVDVTAVANGGSTVFEICRVLP